MFTKKVWPVESSSCAYLTQCKKNNNSERGCEANVWVSLTNQVRFLLNFIHFFIHLPQDRCGRCCDGPISCCVTQIGHFMGKRKHLGMFSYALWKPDSYIKQGILVGTRLLIQNLTDVSAKTRLYKYLDIFLTIIAPILLIVSFLILWNPSQDLNCGYLFCQI